MCGINGLLSFTPTGKELLKRTEASTNKLTLRGPDGGGTIILNNCALGHRRLSIIDTSNHAAQPMTDPTGRFTIVFNGEILNYRELKKQYFPADFSWSSSSDTEVLLHLYIKQKAGCLNLLSGFFAFAIYDSQEDELFLARDRFGKKPLLFYKSEDYFAFSSEMKSLLSYDIPRKLNHTALLQYLQLNYIPQDTSIIENVQKVPPGHYLCIKNNKATVTKSYYHLDCNNNTNHKLPYSDACEKLVELLDNSVQKRMIADVPLGAFLSGGIDSSVVVALAARHTDHLNTFSIGYKDNPFFDETAYAQLVAKKYKTHHTVFSLNNADFLTHIDAVLDYIDEPFADSSAIPVYILSHETRKHVTVALSGDGGDEVFAGYNKHQAEWRMRQGGLLNEIIKLGAPIWKRLPQSRNNKIANIFRQLDRFAQGAKLDVKDRYWRWAGFLTKEQASTLLTPAALAQTDEAIYETQKTNILQSLTDSTSIEDFLATDMKLVLGGDMLVKVDMMSMANSLEVRSPFLDHEVVDYAFSLPTAYKVNYKMKKKIVQDAFRHLLPEELYNRPKKGFEIPLLDWFQNELKDRINNEWLSDELIKEQGIFNLTAIQQLKAKLFSNNPGDAHATIWALIVFQNWWKKYFLN